MILQHRKLDLIRNESSFKGGLVGIDSSPGKDGIVPIGLCLLTALTPLVFAAWLFEPYIAAKEILVQAGTATVALLCIFMVRTDFRKLPLTPVWLPLILLGLIATGSVLWSDNRSVSFDEVQHLATYFLLFAVALHVMRRPEVRTALATTLILAGGIEAVYVLLQYTIGDPIFLTGSLPGKWQTFGTLGNPNWTGEFLAVTALVSLGQFISLSRVVSPAPASKPRARNLTMIGLILMVLALAATLARGAWLAFGVGTAAFLIAHRFSDVRLRLKSFILPMAATVTATIAVVVLPLIPNREAFNHLLNVKSINGRALMYAVSGTMIADAPWGGHGLGTYGLSFPNYQAASLAQPWAVQFIPNASFTSYAHNDYLQLWAEIGVFGLLAFGAFVWIILKRGRALAGDPVALGCWAAVISLLINAAVAFPLHLPASLMLFVVLTAVVESTVSKRSLGQLDLPFAVRSIIVLVILILCFSAFRLSYNRLVTDAALWRADSAFRAERWDEAETDLLTAIRYTPNRLDGPTMLGRLHIARGEYDQALLALGQAQKLGYSVEIFDLKATALEASGRRPDAVATLKELVRLRPDLQWPRERLAELGEAANDRSEVNQ